MVTVSFKSDILPLFTPKDIDHMQGFGVELDSYDYMKQSGNAKSVYFQVSSGSMPPPDSGEDPWSEDKVALFKEWMDGGYPP
jgi:hypothetical protein